MATSTFKVKTKTNVSNSGLDTIYTCPSSSGTTALITGLILCNTSGSAITADIQLVSDTSDTETNGTVFLLKSVSIPTGSSLEMLSGGKHIIQATDIIKAQASASSALDVTLSIVETT
jgi:hypothetical protein